VTTIVKRIRKALFHDIHYAEGSLRDALNDLAISGGGSGEHIMRRIRYNVFHASSVNSEPNLRAALADLEIAGAGSGRRIIQRIREAIFESRREEESDLRHALFDLIGGGGGGNNYHAAAVHFDGSTILQNNSFSCTDSYYVLCSMWLKLPLPAEGQHRNFTTLCSDPDNEINNLFNGSVHNDGDSQ
jgi:hypothetical protein